MTFPDLKTIPKHYFKPSDRPGTLEILNYPTFETFSYTTSSPIPIEKEAVIYLPYGYSTSKNIQWFILVMVVGPMNAQPWEALILPMPSNTLWITRLQMEKLPQLSLLISHTTISVHKILAILV